MEPFKFNLDRDTFYIHSSLSGDDLSFFYNCIGWETLQRWPLIYDWDTVVNEFAGKIKFVPVKGKTLISEMLIDNTIIFNVDNFKNSDQGLPAPALFRHLRNAFAHYRIVRDNEWYILTDINKKGKITLKGKVNAQLLFDFCYQLYVIKERFINK